MARRVDARGLTTKRAVGAELAHHTSGYLLGAAVGAGLALRRRHLRRGRPVGPGDLAAVLAVVALQPVVEWGLHRHVLHARPRTVAGLALDPGAAHRGHHRVPNDVAGALLGPPFALANGAAVAGVAGLVGRTVGGPAAVGTGVVAGEAGLLAYEWTHLLTHSGYRPRTAWFRRVRAAHLRHHHRDETANFGITSQLVDRLLGTSN